MWNFTLRMGNEEHLLLKNRLKDIVRDATSLLDDGQELSKILLFRDKILQMIGYCFDNNKAMVNILYNTLEEILLSKEDKYSQALSNLMLGEGED